MTPSWTHRLPSQVFLRPILEMGGREARHGWRGRSVLPALRPHTQIGCGSERTGRITSHRTALNRRRVACGRASIQARSSVSPRHSHVCRAWSVTHRMARSRQYQCRSHSARYSKPEETPPIICLRLCSRDFSRTPPAKVRPMPLVRHPAGRQGRGAAHGRSLAIHPLGT